MESVNGSGPRIEDAPLADFEEPSGPVSPLRWIFRVVAGVLILASFSTWVYAYSGFADRPAPDLLGDRALAVEAENICAAALTDIDAMPNALDAIDGPDRAVQIRNTTARFDAMVTDLEGLNLFDARDQQIFTDWLSNWRVILNDRLIYADAIAVDPQAQFLVTDVGVSERLDRRLTRFANTNLMTSCAAPTDVG